MPLYEYRCRECGSMFDALRSMSAADSPIPCPSCGGTQTARKLSLFAAHSEGKALAGSGGCRIAPPGGVRIASTEFASLISTSLNPHLQFP